MRTLDDLVEAARHDFLTEGMSADQLRDHMNTAYACGVLDAERLPRWRLNLKKWVLRMSFDRVRG